MNNLIRFKWAVLIAPIAVILLSRAGAELSLSLLSKQTAWVLAFAIYYIILIIVNFLIVRFLPYGILKPFSFSIKPFPSSKALLLGVIIPAMLPIMGFIAYAGSLSFSVIIYILIFSIINPVFEEGFWRGLLVYLPMNKLFVVVYSALMFSISHYFVWGFWLDRPMVMPIVLISSFVMGVCWLWFLQKEKNILYPIISHAIVNVLSLSVALYAGLIPSGQVG